MKYLLPFLLLLLPAALWGQKLNFDDGSSYDPFFSVEITDNEDQPYSIARCSFIPINKENPETIDQKFFFWIRRGTNQGLATYTVDFNKVQLIEFTDTADEIIEGFTPALLTLTSGKQYEVFVATEGFIDGIDEEFGTYVRFYINYNLLKKIEFRHTGTYKRCPFCETLFYNTEMELCPFDKSELVPQHSRE